MKHCSFRALQDADPYSVFSCNRASAEQSLMVNSAGITNTPFYFSTDSRGRRLDYYFMYITDGELQCQLNGQVKLLTAGTVLIFPPAYRYVYTHSPTSEICYYYAHFTGGEAEALLNRYGLSDYPFLKNIGKSQRIISYFDQLFSAISKKDEYFEQECALKLGSILLHLAKRIRNADPKSEEHSLNRSLDYLHTRFQEPINLEMLANLENLSVSRYCAVFKKHYGISPIQYLIGIRIENACELLKSTDISIQDCAHSCGYANEYFFNRQFKKHTGIPPSKFRAQFL